jgi:hypothetical protein
MGNLKMAVKRDEGRSWLTRQGVRGSSPRVGFKKSQLPPVWTRSNQSVQSFGSFAIAFRKLTCAAAKSFAPGS